MAKGTKKSPSGVTTLSAGGRSNSAKKPSTGAVIPDEFAGDMATFQKWMRDMGITWDESLLDLRGGAAACSGAAWGVFARAADSAVPPTTSSTQPPSSSSPATTSAADGMPSGGGAGGRGVRGGDLLCTIPLTAVLSAANSSLADALAAERVGGGLALVAAVVHELSLGAKSPWHGYLLSLPKREYVPVFWSAEELKDLAGTELEGKTDDERVHMRQDYEMLMDLFVQGNDAGKYKKLIRWSGWTLDNFMAAASWVASRAFFVDREHGMSMVPLADVFNHKAGVVSLAGDFQIAELDQDDGDDDDDDDEEEGSSEAEEDEEDEEGGSEDEAADGGSEDDSEDDGTDSDGQEEEHHEHPHDHSTKHSSKHCHDPSCSTHHPATAANGAACGLPHGGASSASAGMQEEAEETEAAQAAAMRTRTRVALDLTAPPVFRAAPQVAGGTGGKGGDGSGDGGGDAAGGGGVKDGGAAVDRSGMRSEVVVKDGVNLQLEIAICVGERDGTGVLEIVAACDVAAGAEVHNTYGEIGNDELVHRYGFALRQNPFNEVQVSKAAVLAGCQEVVGKRNLQRRQQFLESKSQLLSEDEEPFCILPGGKINMALFAALCVLAAQDPPLARWRSVQQAVDETLGLVSSTADSEKPSTAQAVAPAAAPLHAAVPPVVGAHEGRPCDAAATMSSPPSTAAATAAAPTADANRTFKAATSGIDTATTAATPAGTKKRRSGQAAGEGGGADGPAAVDAASVAGAAAAAAGVSAVEVGERSGGQPKKKRKNAGAAAEAAEAAACPSAAQADPCCPPSGSSAVAEQGAAGDQAGQSIEADLAGPSETAEAWEEVAITPGKCGWSAGLLAALRHALMVRAAQYPPSASKDRERLDALNAPPHDRSEHASAQRAALTLRITEHEIVTAALVATNVAP